MKKIFFALLSVMVVLASACGSIPGSETSEVTEENGNHNKLSVENTEAGMKNKVSGDVISQPGPYGSISVTLPDGWKYELCPVDDEKLFMGDYGIHIYPETVTDGFVEIAYASSFGVCGTGLKEEQMTIAGDTANVGYYDGSKIWSFVSFRGKNENIIATTNNVDAWWTEYSDQVMEILDTMRFDAGNQSGTIGVYHPDSEVEKLALSVSAEHISETKATLKFQQYDPSVTAELSFGEPFVIQKKDGENWKEADIIVEGEYGFHDVAYAYFLLR